MHLQRRTQNNSRCCAVQLCLAVLATVLPSTAAAWPSGYISPPAAAPEFNPAAWNQAYKLTLKGVPAASAHNGTKALLQAIRFPNTMLQNVQLPQDCSDTGFDSTAAETVPLGACFSRRASPSTVDIWIKLPGLALVNGNCYCYALDLFQGGYCMPGTRSSAAGNSYRQIMSCAALSEAVVSDGGQPVSRQEALSGAQPSSGHYIALMARPESCIKGHCYVADFHAMRKDSSGSWSWKNPGMPATNRDLFGALVRDPEAAALLGSYQLCGYFRVEPQKMLHVDDSSHREPGPLPIDPALDNYRAMPGVQIQVTALPYNPVTDTAMTPTSQEAVAEDTAWERLRGSEQYAQWTIREKQALGLLPRGVVVARDTAAVVGGSEQGARSAQPRRLLMLSHQW